QNLAFDVRGAETRQGASLRQRQAADLDLGVLLAVAALQLEALAPDLLEHEHLVALDVAQHAGLDRRAGARRRADADLVVAGQEQQPVESNFSVGVGRQPGHIQLLVLPNLILLSGDLNYRVHYKSSALERRAGYRRESDGGP